MLVETGLSLTIPELGIIATALRAESALMSDLSVKYGNKGHEDIALTFLQKKRAVDAVLKNVTHTLEVFNG